MLDIEKSNFEVDDLFATGLSLRSAENVAKMLVPKIVTLSSKVVPNEDGITDGDETSGSGHDLKHSNVIQRSLGMILSCCYKARLIF